MEMGPDGKLYILEYGTGWVTKNDNSSRSVIEYNPGNRVPEAHLAIAQKAGSLPFALDLDASESFDPDDDKLSYSFYLNDELIEQTDQSKISHTIEEAGIYRSEERRVGKECRSRRWAEHEKKKRKKKDRRVKGG